MNKFQIQGAVLLAIFDRESGLSCNVWICNESFCLQTSSFKELWFLETVLQLRQAFWFINFFFLYYYHKNWYKFKIATTVLVIQLVLFQGNRIFVLNACLIYVYTQTSRCVHCLNFLFPPKAAVFHLYLFSTENLILIYHMDLIFLINDTGLISFYQNNFCSAGSKQ